MGVDFIFRHKERHTSAHSLQGNQNSVEGEGGLADFGHPNEHFMALFSCTLIFNSITRKELRFVDRAMVGLRNTVFTQQRGFGRHTHLLGKEINLLAAMPTFTLKHHKKQTAVKVKSFQKH